MIRRVFVDQFKSLLLAIGTWMIVVEARELFLKNLPLNGMALGAMLILAVLIWNGMKK